MTQLLNKYSKLLTVRVSVPTNTKSNAPYKLVITSQLPILESVKVWLYSAAGAVTPLETGFRLTMSGVVVIPEMGSYDDLTTECYAAIMDTFEFDSGEINTQIPGPAYDMSFHFYNLDAAAIAYYIMQIKVAPKVELPLAPITDDKKEKVA